MSRSRSLARFGCRVVGRYARRGRRELVRKRPAAPAGRLRRRRRRHHGRGRRLPRRLCARDRRRPRVRAAMAFSAATAAMKCRHAGGRDGIPRYQRVSCIHEDEAMRTIGKNRGLARLADEDGHFRMVALDQRPPMFDAIAKARGSRGTRSNIPTSRRPSVSGREPCAALQLDAVRSELRGACRDRSAAAALRPDHDARRAPRRGNRRAAASRARSPTGAWTKFAPWAATPSRCWPGTGRMPMPR